MAETELYNVVINSICLIGLARQISTCADHSVLTDKDLSKLLILRLKMKTATQVLTVSTLLNVLESHHNKLFDI